jgi:UrcA family protein
MKTELKTWYESARFALIGTLVLICAAPYAAVAQDPQPLSRTVAYGDLNLDSPEGARVLYARLRSAARTVCEPARSPVLMNDRSEECYRNALAKAVAQVNKSTLTKLYKQSTGKEKVG